MKSFPILSFFIVVLSFLACSSGNTTVSENATDGKISIADFKTKLANTSNAQLIDVRTPAEVSKGTLKNAINMDFRAADFETQINTLDKSKPVFIFCQSGGRSGKGYKKMKDMGFSEVYDMEGGYGAWSKQ